MATIEYALFRAKFIRPTQMKLFVDPSTPSEIFRECITSRPSAAYRRVEWHVGNVEEYDEGLGYFRVGKTKLDTVSEFDDDTGDFVDREGDTTEYAHCLFDLEFGTLAIAKNWRLTQSVLSVANIVTRLFGSVPLVADNDITVEVAPIPNPDEFVDMIISAHQVTKFSATFTGPNPFDADEYFQKPLATLCGESRAERGKAELVGDDLDREVLVEVTRSTAATGNVAKARIRADVEQPLETISLEGKPMTLIFEEDEHEPIDAARQLRVVYKRIRATEGPIDGKS